MAGIWTRLSTNDNDLPDEDASLSVHMLDWAAKLRAGAPSKISRQAVFDKLHMDADAQADWIAMETAYAALANDVARLKWIDAFEAVLGAYKEGLLTEAAAKELLGIS